MSKLKKYMSLEIAILGIVIGIVSIVVGINVITISNFFFTIGILLVIIGCIFLLAKGHLFTGWRIFHRKGDNERFENEKIPAKQVGRLKNAKIVVNRPAKFTLLIGLTWVFFAILITI